MRKIFTFNEFNLNESSAAGNMEQTYVIPFAYTSNDPKNGYNSKSFSDDLGAVFIEKPNLKKEIMEFLSLNLGILKIEELATIPFINIARLIPEIERIIEAGEYEPETTMPGGGLLFIRNKIFTSGRGADFYINRKGTKIEVVTEDETGNENVRIFDIKKFPFDRFEFTEDEREELEALSKAKNGANS
jgi:hypothetical protein